MIFMGKVINVEEVYWIGLVNEVVFKGEFFFRVLELVIFFCILL